MSSRHGTKRSLPSRVLRRARRLPLGYVTAMRAVCTELPRVGKRRPRPRTRSTGAAGHRRLPGLVHTAVQRIPGPPAAGLSPQQQTELHDAATAALSGVVPAAELADAWPAPGHIAPVWWALQHRRQHLSHRAIRYGDAPEQVLDVWRAKDVPTQPAPVLVFVPGGAWVRGKRILQGYALMSHLAQQGWLCVAINHRAGRDNPWPSHLLDVKAAVAWTRAHAAEFGGDPEFVAICGASSGAHLAALTALTHDDHDFSVAELDGVDTSVDAVAALYGRYDWETTSTRLDKGFVQFLEHVVVGKRFKEHPHLFRSASPIARVRSDAPPFFVVHGTADRFVPVSHARSFVEKLRATSQSPVGYLEVPDGRHCFDLTDGLRTGTAVTAIGLFLSEMYRRKRMRACDVAVRTATGSSPPPVPRRSNVPNERMT